MKQTKCNTLLFSYKETQLYCVRLEGHKGDCRFHPSDKWRETEALMEFMDKCVRKTIERKDKRMPKPLNTKNGDRLAILAKVGPRGKLLFNKFTLKRFSK